MKSIATVAFAIIAGLSFAQGDVERGLRKLNANKIKYCWFYGYAKFEGEEKEADSILEDSAQWLTENQFFELELIGDELTAKELVYMKSRWFAKKFGDEGALLIRVNPAGSYHMAVAGNRKPPELRPFWVRMIREFEPFALFMNSHTKNTAMMDPKEVRKSINEDVKRLMSRTKKAEQDAAPQIRPR